MSAGGSRAYQASGAAEAQPARDPAMEDILASIRRIISDDQRALGLGEIQPSRTAGRRPNEDAARTRPSIDRDLQRLTAIRPRLAEADEPTEPYGPARPVLPPREHDRVSRELDLDDERTTRGADHAGREDEFGLREAGRPPRDTGRHTGDPRLPKAYLGYPEAPPADYRPQSQAGDRLTSRSVDASVGSAFDALTASIAHRARTMEEVVAEMLRPMLREWLDDNLPDLVEQLVRSEIERVVRGGRRE